MIKPHGAETLTPLYVSDDAERAELTKEAEQLPSVPALFRCCCISRYAGIRLLHTADRLYEHR